MTLIHPSTDPSCSVIVPSRRYTLIYVISNISVVKSSGFKLLCWIVLVLCWLKVLLEAGLLFLRRWLCRVISSNLRCWSRHFWLVLACTLRIFIWNLWATYSRLSSCTKFWSTSNSWSTTTNAWSRAATDSRSCAFCSRWGWSLNHLVKFLLLHLILSFRCKKLRWIQIFLQC